MSYGQIYLNGVNYSGSHVEPNPTIPTGATVTPLSNVKVDDDYFSIGGGGGGGGTSSDDYSTTERVVGTWIDDRPLYEKTYHDANTWTSTNVEILDSSFTPDVYDNFFVTSMFFMVNNSYMNGSGNVGSAGMEVSCNQTNGLAVSSVESVTVDNFNITIRYTKVADN